MNIKQLNSFEKNIDIMEECWLWIGNKLKTGYGYFWHNGKTEMSHRVSYEHWNGNIPDGTEIHHKCHNRSCVNPQHLEVLTHRENLMESETVSTINIRKIHCLNGHKFTPDNTYTRKSGGRECKACKKARIKA